MQPNLLLIDALNLIRRVHAAVRAVDDESQVTGAISSTISSLSRALRDCQPSHVLVVFDGNPPTWRHKLYPDYKKNRKPMPEPLRKRLGEFNQAILQLGLKTFRRSGLEADDVIAAIASKAVLANVEVTILSTDRVFHQLLTSPLIRQRDHFQKLDANTQTVVEQYGLEPSQLVDFWSIAGVGDVPGVQGVGEKGAAKLLQTFGSLEGVIKEGSDHSSAGRKVAEQPDQAWLSHKLAKLSCDLDVGIRLKDLRYKPVTEATG